MLKNYLKITLRKIFQNKINSFIKIAGLAAGMAIFILIMLNVQFDLSYDKFHRNYHRIYKVEQVVKYSTGNVRMTITPAPVGPALMRHIKEIRDCVRIGVVGKILIASHGNRKKFNEGLGFFVSSSFLDVFTFPMIKGNPQTALSDPHSIVLTEKMAKKYFPDEEPLGKILRLKKQYDFKVTGVITDPPLHSYFKFSFLLPFSSYQIVVERGVVENWNINRFHTYVLLHPQQNPVTVDEKVRDIPKKYMGQNSLTQLHLKPFSECHLDNIQYSEGETTNVEAIYMFSVIALFILVIACVNFMNLTTANAADREKEVKIRKVVGAGRRWLITQFLVESIIITLIAAAASLLLVKLLLPEFNHLLEKQLTMSMMVHGVFPVGLIAVTLLVGIISGSYPAFYLSAPQPVKVISGSSKIGKKSSFIRKVLVTFQFFISIVLIVLSITIYQLVNHLIHVDLGFHREHLLVCTFNHSRGEPIDKYEAFKNELLKNSNILNASLFDELPGMIGNATQVIIEGGSRNDIIWFHDTHIDDGFIDTFGIELIEGRNFSKEFLADKRNRCIINEKAANVLGLHWQNNQGEDSPIGKEISAYGHKFTIIGVVKDFSIMGFQPIKPLMMRLHQDRLAKEIFLTVKVTASSGAPVLDFIKLKFMEFFPDDIFDFKPFEDIFFIRRFFERIDKILKLIGSMSLIAVFIAIFGLFSMASYSTRRRWKEIGIRKVFGAPVSKILLLLVTEYLIILAIANVFAWPLSYFLGNRILQGTVYRIPMQWWVFPAVGLLSFLVGMVTIGSHTIKAAQTNPADTLRYE